MEFRKKCVLDDGQNCTECGECDRCDLNPEKTCDNCMLCVKTDSDFAAIRIDGVLTDEEALDGEDGTR